MQSERPNSVSTLRRQVSAYRDSLLEIPTQAQLGQRLVLAAVGGGVQSDPADLLRRELAGEAAEEAKRSAAQLSMVFLQELYLTGDPEKAARAVVSMRGVEAGVSRVSLESVSELGPRVSELVSREARLLDDRPATLLRNPSGVDQRAIREALASLAEGTSGRESVSTYDSKIGDGTDFPLGGAPSQGTPPEPAPGGGRDFYAMNRWSENGGIVIGRPREGDDILDIRSISWSRRGDELDLNLLDGQGQQHLLSGFDPEIVHLALVYVADGRKTAVTIQNAAEVGAQRILLHPALLDTALGCRVTAFDQYVFDLIGEETWFKHEVQGASVAGALYNYVVNRRVVAFGRAMADREDLSRGVNAAALAQSENNLSEFHERLSVSWEKEAASAPFDNMVRFLKTEQVFFEQELVDLIAECGAPFDRWAAFDQCVSRSVENLLPVPRTTGTLAEDILPTPEFDARRLRVPRRTSGLPPLNGPNDDTLERAMRTLEGLSQVNFPGLTTPSGVRDRPWRLNPDFSFAQPEKNSPATVFTSFVQAVYTNERDFSAARDLSMDDPYRFPSIAPRIETLVLEQMTKNEDETDPITEFALLNRLFIAAFDGQFGDEFPLEHLVLLAGDTAADLTVMRTKRYASVWPVNNLWGRGEQLSEAGQRLRTALKVEQDGEREGERTACPPM